MTPEEAAARALRGLDPAALVGVAVSGGGDSMALLHATCAVAAGRRVLAATVDHGLRPESVREAEAVARACAALGVPHETLRWDGAGRGNRQERAREGRRALLGGWGRRQGVALLILGHTADDQAETVLLRLARGSGVDGLAGMPEAFAAEGVEWRRPFLGLSRESLRAWLSARNLSWFEDPSNDDPRFDRARARAMMDDLSHLGLTRERLLRTAAHMARARTALADRARRVAAEEAREDGADLLVAPALLRRIEEDDAAGRVLAAALLWVGGEVRRPRWASLCRLAAVVGGGRAATLAGCLVRPEGGWARISPEGRRPAPAREAPGRFTDFGAFG